MLEQVKTREDLHLPRKIFHLLSIQAILMCMIFLPGWLCWTIYIFLGLPLIALDYSRRYFPKLNSFCLKIAGAIVRKHELRKMTGASWTIVSVGLTFLIFPKPISFLAVLFLSVGDPTASFFGLLYGKTRFFGSKSFRGTLAGFFFCSFSAMVFFSLYYPELSWSTPKLFGLSFACGLLGAASEVMSFFNLDDNLTQPLVSGVLLWLLMWQMGGSFV